MSLEVSLIIELKNSTGQTALNLKRWAERLTTPTQFY
jgi:hypothetical protein